MSEVLRQADVAFGQQASNGILTELIKRFDPTLAEILLKFILSRQAAGALSSLPPGAGASSFAVGLWIAAILDGNREELLLFLKEREGELLDAIIAALRRE